MTITIQAAQTGYGALTKIVRSDAAGFDYRQENWNYFGSQVMETSIVRSGGASDSITPVSWKLTSTTNTSFDFPFECDPLRIWNPNTAKNVTATIFGATSTGGVPNNDDIWMELAYLGNASFPLASFVSSGKANTLVANAAYSVDAVSSWGGSPGGTLFSMSVTMGVTNLMGTEAFSTSARSGGTAIGASPQPGLAGYLTAYVKIGKNAAAPLYYIDPAIVLS